MASGEEFWTRDFEPVEEVLSYDAAADEVRVIVRARGPFGPLRCTRVVGACDLLTAARRDQVVAAAAVVVGADGGADDAAVVAFAGACD